MTEPVTTSAPTPPPAAPPAATSAPSTLLGGGAPAATPPAAGQPPAPATLDAVGNPWEKWAPERRGFFENKGWLKEGKLDVDALADGYQQLEKFRGIPPEEQFRLSKNPSADELARIHERLGVPKEPSGYGLKGEPGTDPASIEKMQAIAHAAKLTPDQLRVLTEHSAAEARAAEARETQAETEALRAGHAELSQEWGPQMKLNQAIALRGSQLEAFTSEGMDEGFWAHAAKYPGMNPAKIARALYKLGVGLGEDRFVSGAPSSGGVRGPESAEARLEQMITHEPTRKALMAGDPDLTREKAELEKVIIEARRKSGT